MNTEKDILIGNTFAFTLIRRAARIVCLSRETFRRETAGARVHSFWGHSLTAAAAGAWLGIDLTPGVERPVVTLTHENFPTLDGVVFREVYVCSPQTAAGRPKIGTEFTNSEIRSWRLLKIVFGP